MKTTQSILAVIVGIMAFVAFTWGLYWLAKTGSYFFFYEDMVQETIREMVEPDFLRKE